MRKKSFRQILDSALSAPAPLFRFQGQKGERGPPGKALDGAIKFGDTADNCTLSIAGTVRYSTSQETLQLCDGRAWLAIMISRKGLDSNSPGRHCLDILNSGEFLNSRACCKE